MVPDACTHRTLRFGVFEVDLRIGELRKNGIRVKLQEQPFHILALLLQHPGELVSRDDLRHQLWADDTFVDFDRNLNKAINKLRLSLGDSADNPRFIETLHRKGYRFIAPVTEIVTESPNIQVGQPKPAEAPTGSPELLPAAHLTGISNPPRHSRTAVWLGLVLLSVGIAIILGSWNVRLRSQIARSQPRVKARKSVAVLTFTNLSGRPDEAWLSTALSDWLITDLSAGEQLRVIPAETVSRTAMELSPQKAMQEPIRLDRNSLGRIGKELGADVIVAGSYAKLGVDPDSQIRLDLWLEDLQSGATMDAISESGSESHLFELVSRGGEELRAKLGVQGVTREEAASVALALPSSPEAARFYSEGMAKIRVFDALSARDSFRRSIAIDPNFALSHSALASAWAALGYDQQEKAEAKRALDLSAQLPRAERLWIEARYNEASENWDKAIELYRALFEFFPDNLEYGLSLAHAQVAGGKGQEALETIEQLKHLPTPIGDDPRIDLAEGETAESLGDFRRNLIAAGRAATKARSLGASLLLAQARTDQAWAFDNLGPLSDAVSAAEEAKQLFGSAGDKRGMAQAATVAAIALNLQGQKNKAKQIYEECLNIYRELGDRRGYAVELNNLADVLQSTGDLKGAQAKFEQALATYMEIGHQDGVAMAKSNLGDIYLALGDRERAKQMYLDSLQICRRIGDRSKAAGNLAGLGEVSRTEGAFEEARSHEQEAISIFGAIGDKSSAAQTEIALAMLLLDESRNKDAAATASRAASEFQRLDNPSKEAWSYAVLAQAELAQQKLREAQDSISRAAIVLGKSPDSRAELFISITAARVRAAYGSNTKRAEALQSLRQVISSTTSNGCVACQLEARLALAEIEVGSQDPFDISAFESLEKDASVHGFSRIARRAAEDMSRAHRLRPKLVTRSEE